MKHLLQHSICIALAAYFVLAGCGFNVAHYCCEACAEHGRRMFSTSSCDEVHRNHRHHEHADAHCCESHQSEGYNVQHNACTLQRVATDISTIDQLHIDLEPMAAVCATLPERPNAAETLRTHGASAASHAPPLLCTGRSVLTRIELLLI